MANIFDITGGAIQKLIGKHGLFIFYIVVLLLLYIGSRYRTEKVVRDIFNLSSEVAEQQKRYLKIKTWYQQTTSMGRINTYLESIGVGISKEPIKDIILLSEEKVEKRKK